LNQQSIRLYIKPVTRKSQSNFAVNCYEWIEAFITSLIVVVILFTFCFRVVNVNGPSMLPTLKSNDRVVLSSCFYKPRQGDVVVISHTQKLREPIIKRVIALENQRVDIDFEKGVVSVDGVPLDESAYIRNGITDQPTDFKFPLTVPAGHVFVLGDNRAVSNDSRFSDVGMVDVRNILGKAEMVVFPFDRVGKIK
jgi:signal peptidase I